jgi:hypothetical protein
MPDNVYRDSDGNWLAVYTLPASKKLNVIAKGDIRVYLNPKKEDLTANAAQNYLKQEPYWEVNNPKIQSLAKRLKTPQNIYKYV